MIFLLIYLALSAVLYAFLRKFTGKHRFVMPKSAVCFYVLTFTWGLPMTLAGAFTALALIASGRRPKRYKRAMMFEHGSSWGVSLGPVFISPASSEHVKSHEYGHGIQNAYLGPFMITAVAIPSAVRFWIRRAARKLKKAPASGYEDIWFEKSATYALPEPGDPRSGRG